MATKTMRMWPASVAAVLMFATLTGCAEDKNSVEQSGGEGIEFGASKEKYREALADIEPIVIRAQSPSPKGSLTGAKFEGYMAAVEDWSDGKVKFDIAYSNAIAPPAEIDDALRDGRLDLGSIVTAYEPQEFKANALFAGLTFAGGQGAFQGLLQSNAWWLDVAYHTPEMMDEFSKAGSKVLVPAFNSGLIALNCSDEVRSAADFKGLTVATGTTAQGDTMKKLGASPTSIAYPEIFESLQRGVVDCSMNSLLVSSLGGFTSETPYVTIDSGAGFGSGPGAWAFSQGSWDSYPLVVQQLLFDRIDAFVESNLESVWETIAKVTTDMKKAGGSVSEYDPAVREVIAGANSAALEKARSADALPQPDAFVDYLLESVDHWGEVVATQYGDEIAYDDFAETWKSGQTDLKPYVDELFDRILVEHRPK